MFLHVSVILSTRGAVCPLHAGIHAPEQTPPWTRGRYPPGPEAGPPQEQTPPGTRGRLPPPRPEAGYSPPRDQTPLDQRQAPPTPVHAGRYSQQAGSTHPTGMQSCFQFISI